MIGILACLGEMCLEARAELQSRNMFVSLGSAQSCTVCV